MVAPNVSLKLIGTTFEPRDPRHCIGNDAARHDCRRVARLGEDLFLTGLDPGHSVLECLQALIDDGERFARFSLELKQVLDLTGKCPRASDVREGHELRGDEGRAQPRKQRVHLLLFLGNACVEARQKFV